MHDDRFALPHAMQHGIAAMHRKEGRVVRVGGSHNGDGEFLVLIGLDEARFAGDLVTRIFPNWIIQHR